MAYVAPTIASFKAQFDRDFPYGSTSDTVKDSDITKAILTASFNVNEGLFDTQANYEFAYNLLAAHCLVMNLKSSSQGIAGSFSWLENSKNVGSVGQSFSIPDYVSQNPLYATFGKTGYGVQYMAIVIPLTYGGVSIVEGATLE